MRMYAPALRADYRLAIVYALFLLLLVRPPERAIAEDNPHWTPQEKFVLKKVAAGEAVDFALSPWKSKQKLSSLFIESLLAGQIKKVHWRGVHIQNAVFSEPLDLTAADVAYYVSLAQCDFQNSVTFRFTRFAKGLDLSGSIFQGPSVFAHMSVNGELDLRRVHFQGSQAVDFASIEVTHDALFNHATFDTVADFTNADIGEQFQAQGAMFLSTGEKYGQDPMPRRGAVFNVMKAGSAVSFAKAIFAGPVDFRGFEAGSQIDFGETQFKEVKEKNYFQFLHAGTVFMTDTVFSGPADFQQSTIVALQIKETTIPELALDGSHFVRLQALDLKTPGKPGKDPALSLPGVTYQLLGHKNPMIRTIEYADFDPMNYVTLEAYLRAHGSADLADEVYIEMRRREARAGGFLGRAWGLLLDWLVAYGRAPERAFFFALIVILFGTGVYWSRSSVQPQNAEDEKRTYSPFWYSFDLLVPAIDLQSAGVWMPRQDSSFRRNYARVHRILGWILIPIGVAALTGFIK